MKRYRGRMCVGMKFKSYRTTIWGNTALEGVATVISTNPPYGAAIIVNTRTGNKSLRNIHKKSSGIWSSKSDGTGFLVPIKLTWKERMTK